MFLSNKELGKKGEEIAAKLLTEKGYEILERNYRYSHGEIDIVAKDPSDGYTVFVEVKARQNLEYGEPEYAITNNKQKQIKKMAELYLFEKEILVLGCRFDVVTVLLQGKGNPIINHYENAFM
ncbi:MAG: YraN family protein [Ignavibacteria bacterium]|nr:YraN family protein [Ignavibacteria bacterium]